MACEPKAGPLTMLEHPILHATPFSMAIVPSAAGHEKPTAVSVALGLLLVEDVVVEGRGTPTTIPGLEVEDVVVVGGNMPSTDEGLLVEDIDDGTEDVGETPDARDPLTVEVLEPDDRAG